MNNEYSVSSTMIKKMALPTLLLFTITAVSQSMNPELGDYSNITLSDAFEIVSSQGNVLEAQVKVDTIYADQDFKKPPLGTYYHSDYRIKEGRKTKYADEILSIKLDDNQQIYKVSIRNETSNQESFSKTTGSLSADSFKLLDLKLNASADSAVLVWHNDRIIGWAQYVNKEPYLFNEPIKFSSFMQSANIPWYLGIIPLKANYSFIVPVFNSYSRGVKWTKYTVTGFENVDTENKTYRCWKIDAGKVGPPGYSKTIWIDVDSGLIVQSTLSKDEKSTKYVMKLQG